MNIRVDDILDPATMTLGGGGDAGEGCDLVAMMKAHNVVWHTTCKNSVNTQKAARCRPATEHLEATTPVKTRRMDIPPQNDNENKQVCFFCEEPCQNGRQVASLSVDKKVRNAAETLGDGKLLGKLALHWNLVAIKAVYHHTVPEGGSSERK